jgi:hypothetical protein
MESSITTIVNHDEDVEVHIEKCFFGFPKINICWEPFTKQEHQSSTTIPLENVPHVIKILEKYYAEMCRELEKKKNEHNTNKDLQTKQELF